MTSNSPMRNLARRLIPWLALALTACPSQEERPVGEPYPLVLAHRGMVHLAPENSIPAIREAVRMGADGSEVDVHLAGSGEVIVIHDEVIDRVTQGTGRVDEMTLEQIRSFPLNPDPAGTYRKEKIPTLEELFQALDKKVILFVEMKRPQGEAIEDGLEEKVGALIHKYDRYESTFVSSFSPTAVARVKAAYPRVRTVFEYHTGEQGIPRADWLAKAGPIFAVGPEVKIISPEVKQWAAKRGYRLSTFSPRTLEEMEKTAALGFHIITTMYPDLYRMVLANGFDSASLAKIRPTLRLDFEGYQPDTDPFPWAEEIRISREDAPEGQACLAIHLAGNQGAELGGAVKPHTLYYLTFRVKIEEKMRGENPSWFAYFIERSEPAREAGLVRMVDDSTAPDQAALLHHMFSLKEEAQGEADPEGWRQIRRVYRTRFETRSFHLILACTDAAGTLLIDDLTLRALPDAAGTGD